MIKNTLRINNNCLIMIFYKNYQKEKYYKISLIYATIIEMNSSSMKKFKKLITNPY